MPTSLLFPLVDKSKLPPALAENYHAHTAQALGVRLAEYLARTAAEEARRTQNAVEYTPITLGASFVLAAMDLMLFLVDQSSLRHTLSPREREELVRGILRDVVDALTTGTANVTTEESDA